VLAGSPKTQSVERLYLDAQPYLHIKAVVQVKQPQIGADVAQATEMPDYRHVDDANSPFHMMGTSDIHTYTINGRKHEHNTERDQAIFWKPWRRLRSGGYDN